MLKSSIASILHGVLSSKALGSVSADRPLLSLHKFNTPATMPRYGILDIVASHEPFSLAVSFPHFRRCFHRDLLSYNVQSTQSRLERLRSNPFQKFP